MDYVQDMLITDIKKNMKWNEWEEEQRSSGGLEKTHLVVV
jgi:hypothetical protein